MEKFIWNEKNILSLFETPFSELIFRAYSAHRKIFGTNDIEFCSLFSIKTGGCPEDCHYCPQSAHYKTAIKKEKLTNIQTVISEAKKAKALGATRFCIGAAWRSPPAKDFPKVLEMIKAVKSLQLETCATLGMLSYIQAKQLKLAGLDFYNHNLDTSPNLYKNIISTRSYQQRIDTISNAIQVGISVCCGGILGMGETKSDIAKFLLTLHNLPSHPKSIPINKLIPIKGTPLASAQPIDNFDFIKTIAITRLMFSTSNIRLSAGRENMSEEMQAWCFMAGANSIFIGNKLLTANNHDYSHDNRLLNKLNINKY